MGNDGETLWISHCIAASIWAGGEQKRIPICCHHHLARSMARCRHKGHESVLISSTFFSISPLGSQGKVIIAKTRLG